MVSVDGKHDVYFNIPSPSLIKLVVSVDVKGPIKAGFVCNGTLKIDPIMKV